MEKKLQKSNNVTYYYTVNLLIKNFQSNGESTINHIHIKVFCPIERNKRDTKWHNTTGNIVTKAILEGGQINSLSNIYFRYHLERRIFHELLELKRLQIRAGKSNEQVLVKRLVDEYKKAGLIVGLKQYDGIYTFKHFERYLYGKLTSFKKPPQVLTSWTSLSPQRRIKHRP